MMLNPSTADADFDDPTIRRCLGFAKAFGFGSLSVINLFGYRATNPKDLLKITARNTDFCHDQNVNELLNGTKLICAWGVLPKVLHAEANQTLDNLRGWLSENPGFVQCLGKTKDGYPRHPLYLPTDTQMQDYKFQLSDISQS